jgi:predicted metal-dependent hydrolase
MTIIQDKEFGKIIVSRSTVARHISMRVAPNGEIHASMPKNTPMIFVKSLIKKSRPELRKMIIQSKPEYSYTNGIQIGKSHTLIIQNSTSEQVSISRHGQQIIVKLPTNKDVNDKDVNEKIRKATIAALRLEAKSYLPKRLSYLADKYNYTYIKTRFSHASSRWGSCSSNGTISLNIALMKLPFELIDYVILHELAHTKQMNHSKDFWNLVSITDPEYKKHKKTLKILNPSI